MALATNAFATYEAKGNREDLTDMIYRIDPTDTPAVSAFDKAKASAVLHEWQTQALASASSSNAVLEGDDVAADAATPTVRVNNYCQISRKVPRVTGTQQAVDKAGRGSEMAYQEMLKGMELKRDLESAITASTGPKVSGGDTTIRRAAGLLSWIATNSNVSTGATSGVDPTGDGTDSRTNGTQRAFTESQLKDVLQKIWLAGGKPDTILAPAFNKQQFSTFTGRASPIEDTRAKKITAAVEAYESDFGTLKVVPDRFMTTRSVLALQTDMWAVAYLNGRRMVSYELGATGDSIWKLMLSEWTLEARNQKASGIIADLTTS